MFLAAFLALFACTSGNDDDLMPSDTGDSDVLVVALTLENVAAPDLIETSGGEKYDVALAPALVVWHTADFTLFTEGSAASKELEALAEDGNPKPLRDALAVDVAGVEGVDVLSVLVAGDGGTYEEAPMHPGEEATVTRAPITAEFATVAFMYGWSNDTFLAVTLPIDALVAETDQDGPTAGLVMYDAGTELNQEPGAGVDQAPLQIAPDTGASEGGVITAFSGDDGHGYTFPAATDVAHLRLTESL